MRDLGSRAAMRWGSSPHARTSVVASFVSLATAFFRSEQTPSRTHSAAPPFQIEPAALGFNLGFYFWGKVRSASFPATAYGYCRKLRSLPCPSFQIRSTWLRICFFLSRATYRSRRRFFFQNKRHRALTPLLLLSKLNPLRWASIWVFYFGGSVSLETGLNIWGQLVLINRQRHRKCGAIAGFVRA